MHVPCLKLQKASLESHGSNLSDSKTFATGLGLAIAPICGKSKVLKYRRNCCGKLHTSPSPRQGGVCGFILFYLVFILYLLVSLPVFTLSTTSPSALLICPFPVLCVRTRPAEPLLQPQELPELGRQVLRRHP